MTCTTATHAALKTDVHVFMEGTRHIGTVDGLRYGNCLDCETTLVLAVCVRCFECCPSGDCIETPKGAYHFACAVARALEKGAAKFVAVVRVTTAKEMIR